MSIHTIDVHFLDTPGAIATYLVPTSAGPVLIETGPYSTIDRLRQEIEALGYRVEDIKHILLTHIHFDHAGAAWWWAQQGATVYVHPRGYRHLAHPEKLIASAQRIYQDEMDRLWGQIEGIAENRLAQMEDRQVLEIGGEKFTAHFTPGHAVHHIAWQWQDQLFTGDVAGVKIEDGIVVPPCPPPDIDVESWQQSLARMREIAPAALHLAHFGTIHDPLPHLDMLENRLLAWANWMKPYYDADTPIVEIVPEFIRYTLAELVAHDTSEEILNRYDLANPAWMSVMGLMRYWKQRKS